MQKRKTAELGMKSPMTIYRQLTELTVAAAALVVGVAWPSDASACKIKPSPDVFAINPTLAASMPAPPDLAPVDVDIRRSQHAPPGNGDCGEVGSLTLRFGEADGTPWPADVGIRLALLRGTLPQTFTITSDPLVTTDGALSFSGGDDPSQSFEFTLQAVGVNAGGVESAPVEVHVTDSGNACACAIGQRVARHLGLVDLACMLLCGVAVQRVRRRTRTPKTPLRRSGRHASGPQVQDAVACVDS